MAKSYLEIQNKAYLEGNIMDWTNALNRLSGVPVDITEVYNSYDNAVKYAATDPVAYEGQLITVTESGDTTVYVITPAKQGEHIVGTGADAVTYEVYIKEVGKVSAGDGQTIDLDEDGVLSLHGAKSNVSGTYVPTLVNGELTWAEPLNDTVDGIQSDISGLKSRTSALELSVYGREAEGTEGEDDYIEGVEGLVDRLAAEVTARGEADLALANRATALEETVNGKDEGESRVKGLTEKLADEVQARIDADGALEDRIEVAESNISDHNTRLGRIEAFFGTADHDGSGNSEDINANLNDALDTLVEIQTFLNGEGGAVDNMLESIGNNTQAIADIRTEIGVAASPAEGTEGEEGYIPAVSASGLYEVIEDAIAAHAEVADAAISAVRATAAAAAAKTYVDSTFAPQATTYTKTEVDTIIGTPGSPAVGETEAVAGTGIFANAYSKSEINDIIADITGGSNKTIAGLAGELGDHKNAYTQKVEELEGAISAAAAKGQQGIDDAAKAQKAADAAAQSVTQLSQGQVDTNKVKIENLTELVSGSKTTSHASRIGSLESFQTEHTSNYNSLVERVAADEALIAQKANTTDVTSLLATKANSDDVYEKEQVYTKDEANAEIKAATDALEINTYAKTTYVNDEIDKVKGDVAKKLNTDTFNQTIANYITSSDAHTAFMTQDEVDDRIATLINAADPEGGKTISNIEALVQYVDENAGDIAQLISDVDKAEEAIEELSANVAKIVQPKSSDEITVATDGTLGLGIVSTDKLTQGNDILVLYGGSASVATIVTE